MHEYQIIFTFILNLVDLYIKLSFNITQLPKFIFGWGFAFDIKPGQKI